MAVYTVYRSTLTSHPCRWGAGVNPHVDMRMHPDGVNNSSGRGQKALFRLKNPKPFTRELIILHQSFHASGYTVQLYLVLCGHAIAAMGTRDYTAWIHSLDSVEVESGSTA